MRINIIKLSIYSNLSTTRRHHVNNCANARRDINNVDFFDFHHVDPLQKDFTISQRMTSFEAIQRELDKCVLLCSRCHREVHEGLHPRLLAREDDDRRGIELDDPGEDWD